VRRVNPSKFVAVLATAALGVTVAPAVARAAQQYPVPYLFSANVIAGATQQGSPPPGANDWSCKPSAAHPRAVVLVHGLFANMTDNWQTMSPLLANNGYCVFALTYGNDTSAGSPRDQFGGLAPMEQSAQQLSAFVDKVLYLKLQSFNIFNQEPQDISTCAVYTYIPLGLGTGLALNPIGSALMAGQPLDLESELAQPFSREVNLPMFEGVFIASAHHERELIPVSLEDGAEVEPIALRLVISHEACCCGEVEQAIVAVHGAMEFA